MKTHMRGRGKMSRDKVLEAEANESILQWLAAVERVSPGDYISIADFEDISGQARADSYFWCDQLFTSEANPHRAAPGVCHSFHVAGPGTFDLLRHEYEAEGLRLSVVESRSFVLVQVAPDCVDILKLPRRDQATRIPQIASQVLQMECSPRFKLPRKITDGCIFCTNPGADPWLLSSWTGRIDAGIRRGALFCLCYKRASQMSQLVGFPSLDQWFDDEFRSKWQR